MSNTVTEITTKPSPSSRMVEEYFKQSEAIIEKARVADRDLLLEETKKLRQLAAAIMDLMLTIGPDEKKDTLIVIRPKLPDGAVFPPYTPPA